MEISGTATSSSSSSSSSSSPHQPMKYPGLIPFLPDELSLQILIRLPIKSLLKFTTVSKSFHFHITSPDFTKSHISTSLSNANNHPNRYLLHTSIFSLTTLYQTPFPSLLQNPVILPTEITYPLRYPVDLMYLVGSINGLVCLVLGENHIIYWNPCLRKCRQLPRINIHIKRALDFCYGFGYDVVGEDYKVFTIFRVFKDNYVYENEVMVFSRNRGVWKTIHGFKESFMFNDPGKFVNGKLHWASNSGKRSIVWIDVGDESFGELEQPVCSEGMHDLVLGVLGEWICVLGNDGKSDLKFWVMKEYGVRESWTKFGSIDCLNGRGIGIYGPPLCLLNDGKVLLRIGLYLVLCDPKDDSRSFIEIRDFGTCVEALVCVESLVLP